MELTKIRALELMQETLDSLTRSNVITAQIDVQPETVLLGDGSALDSIGFVTFVTELEDRVVRETGTPFYIVLDQIQEFSVDQPHLSADCLAEYLVKPQA